METKINNNRKNGIFYTPTPLAEYLVRPLITEGNHEILDPAYGEGSLLLAAERLFQDNKNKSTINLHGCDTKPVNGLLAHLPEANLQKIDFFKFPTENKFDLILVNPPYVRHHFQDNKRIASYRSSFPEVQFLSLKSDLWAYFIVKSVGHLKTNGNVGAILPWSFLQADYSINLRSWLRNKFRQIRLLTLNEKYFENAEARVVLLWLEGYGESCKNIFVGRAESLNTEPIYKEWESSQWDSSKIVHSASADVGKTLSFIKEKFGFAKLENYCDIKIGIVTGADRHFIIDKDEAKLYKFSSRQLIPIISRSEMLVKLLESEKSEFKRLVVLKKKFAVRNQKFIKDGKKKEVDQTVHSKRRNPWYFINVGKTPDCFFPYRTSKVPFLVDNKMNMQCTNSIHRIYFKNVTKTEIKWIQLSILSNIAQLSLEILSKTYGKGMLKVEPRSLKDTLVLVKNDPIVDLIHERVYDCLRKGNKEEAMNLATDFINEHLQIEEPLAFQVQQALSAIHSSRLSQAIAK